MSDNEYLKSLIESQPAHETVKVATDDQCCSSNKAMTLSDAVLELESRGFSCDISSDKSRAVGFFTSFRWLMLARVDVFAFVQEVSESKKLTVEKIEADLKQARLYVDDRTLGVGCCPPQGLSRGNIAILVFLVKGEDDIDPNALSRIVAAPEKEFCKIGLLAAQDGRGRSHYFERTTPLWGKALFPEIRFWAGLLTGRQVDSMYSVFGRSVYWKILGLVYFMAVLASLVASLATSPKQTILFLLFCPVSFSIVHWRNIRARRGKNLQRHSGAVGWCEEQTMKQQQQPPPPQQQQQLV